MRADKDPIAMALYEKYNNLVMPNMRLNKKEAMALIAYMDDETQRLLGQAGQEAPDAPPQASRRTVKSNSSAAVSI